MTAKNQDRLLAGNEQIIAFQMGKNVWVHYIG